MKPFFASFLFCFLVWSACNNKATTKSFLKPSNLESSFISIDADSTYTLKTGKGAVIKIAAGTFSVPAGKKVNIELKEAFAMQDILLAGLSTQSNGKALRSGGMIYFNATSEGKQLDMNKPVGISIPSEIYDPSMQLFKGEIKEDSSINWVEPQALDTTPNAQQILSGKALFKANCSSCHKIFKDFTGPALAGSGKRAPSRQWIYDFMKNPVRVIENGDPYARQLAWKWKPTVMTAFPMLTKYDIDGIMAYIENEGKLNPGEYIEYDRNKDTSIKPCGYDTIIYPQFPVNNSIEIETEKNDSTVAVNVPMPPAPPAADDDKDFFEKDFAIRSGVYGFTIEENGWYNVDVFSDEEKILINASVELKTEADVEAYLFFPRKKTLLYGGLSSKNMVLFHDADKNNYIQAPEGEEAILLLVGSDKTDMYYAVARFITRQKQDILLQPKKTTEAGLMELIKKNNIDGFKIDTYKKETEIIEKPCDGWPEAQQPTAVYSDMDLNGISDSTSGNDYKEQ